MDRLGNLIAAAEADALTVRMVTRVDGTTVQGIKGHGSAEDGPFQVYVVPVTQRTRAMREHYRATYYLRSASGEWKRTSKAAFSAALGATVSPQRT